MKNKRFFTLLLAIAMFTLTANTAMAQCDYTVTDNTPYIEDFESDDGVACWDVNDIVGNGMWNVMAGSESTAAAFTYDNQGDEARLVSPVINIAVESAMLTFSYAMIAGSVADELSVSYRTSETDEWHVMGTYNVNDWNNFYEGTLILPEVSSTFQISFFCHGNGTGLYVLIDNIEIISTVACPRPVNLQAYDITATSAVFSWDTSDSQESWIIELNGEEELVLEEPYHCETLTSGTSYTFRVKANCGEGLESEWATPIFFNTPCERVIVTNDTPYYEDFEWAEFLACWENQILIGNFGWDLHYNQAEDNHSANFTMIGGSGRLVSTPMDITGVSSPTLAFNHKQPENVLGADELTVLFRKTGEEDWHLLSTLDWVCNDWEEAVISLPEPSPTYQIAFTAKSNYSNGVYIDNIKVGDASCVGVNDLTAKRAKVSPNPSSGKVTVESGIGEGTVMLYDMFGKMVATAKLVDGRAEMELGGVAKGVYTATIVGEGMTETVKIVRE